MPRQFNRPQHHIHAKRGPLRVACSSLPHRQCEPDQAVCAHAMCTVALTDILGIATHPGAQPLQLKLLLRILTGLTAWSGECRSGRPSTARQWFSRSHILKEEHQAPRATGETATHRLSLSEQQTAHRIQGTKEAAITGEGSFAAAGSICIRHIRHPSLTDADTCCHCCAGCASRSQTACKSIDLPQRLDTTPTAQHCLLQS
jgi:hypothetical protein